MCESAITKGGEPLNFTTYVTNGTNAQCAGENRPSLVLSTMVFFSCTTNQKKKNFHLSPMPCLEIVMRWRDRESNTFWNDLAI